jgi:hypothetical protein
MYICTVIKKTTQNMKKVFAIFAIVGLMATASCGNKEVTEEVAVEEVVVEEAPAVEAPAVDSTAVAADSTAAQ